MHLNFNRDPEKNVDQLRRLGLWYVVALGIIAAVAVAGQVLIQRHLSNQLHDSRVVNVAGKQRMLSQQITKTVLFLQPQQDSSRRREILQSLKSSVTLFKISHRGLQHGDDSLNIPADERRDIVDLFGAVNAHYTNIERGSDHIIGLLEQNFACPYDSLQPSINNILAHEAAFLAGMDDIALGYANEGDEKVSNLRRIEYALLFIALLVLGLELLLIFKPTVKNINKTMDQLMTAERNARKLSKEIGALYASLEKSYEQVAMVNQPVDNPRLFAKADRGGNLIFIADHFRTLVSDSDVGGEGLPVAALFKNMQNADDWMDEVIDTVSDGHFWQGEVQYSGLDGDARWATVIVTPVFNEEQEVDELLVMGADITRRKLAEQSMRRKNRAEIEKKINQQKFRSVLILEGQEEERNRIAMDIHDGIGQMLTSLKYQIESIDVTAGEKAREKMAEVDQLIKQVIREVRRVTFNLKPPVLADYGLQAALKVFVQETSKLVDVKLVYNTSGHIDRLPQKTENNIFRIVQEAINNAIKYSGADRIEVSLAQAESNLVIKVKDEGKGFDARLIEARSVNIESGRGFFNMYERTEYVNGQLSIHSKPNEGTTVTLTVPVTNNITMEV